MSIGRILGSTPTLGAEPVSGKAGNDSGNNAHQHVLSRDVAAQLHALMSSIEDHTIAAKAEGAGMASSALGQQLLFAVRSLSAVMSVHPTDSLPDFADRAKSAMDNLERNIQTADESAYRLAEKIGNSSQARSNWEGFASSLREAVAAVRQNFR